MHHFLKAFLCLGLMIAPAFAQNEEKSEPTPSITIDQAYTFATMPGGETGASFMVIKNDGELDDTLIDVKSDTAKNTEIHESKIDDNGTMMMRRIKSITVPSKEKTVLDPRGKHIMLIKLKEPLTLDRKFPLTLVFKNSWEKVVDVLVIQPGTELKTEEAEESKKTFKSDDVSEKEGFPESGFSQNNKDFWWQKFLFLMVQTSICWDNVNQRFMAPKA